MGWVQGGIGVRDRNMTPTGRILIIDRELSMARMAAEILRKSGYQCEVFPTLDAAVGALDGGGADVVIAAIPGGDLMETLKRVHAKAPDAAVVVSAPTPSADAAAQAVRNGAFDFVAKPFNSDELNSVVGRAVELSALQRENRRLREQLDVAAIAAEFIAESPRTRALVSTIRRVAPSRATALIQGETGTGKELVARMLHFWSRRAEGPFVAVNCKAFADGVVESELFGHEKGSFTGAIRERAGCFERASGGTLFLDEIGEAGPDFQAKLLRVLEDGEVMRVGASKSRKVDVRIVTASNRNLRNEVARGAFRADLFFRLNVIPLNIPPLRERSEDILALARHFLTIHSADAGRPITLSQEAEQLLLDYSWPGNVRELENVIERAVVMSGAEVLTPEAFAFEEATSPAEGAHASRVGVRTEPGSASASPAMQGTLQEALDRAASERIRIALDAANGNRVEAAAALGVDRTTLYRLMKRLGL
ncbi:MAG TPA: sigma-54 dependent transcriptional regulator [Candidatus Binataceae bacterium]|nr:sigma-54 dependent transcriptional regulator [Candidatus Binataceae bacterium]